MSLIKVKNWKLKINLGMYLVKKVLYKSLSALLIILKFTDSLSLYELKNNFKYNIL